MKRRKTIRAGRLVWDVIYTVPRPNASQHERKRIRAVTAEQVAQTNCNTAQRKLEMLMATNFEPDEDRKSTRLNSSHGEQSRMPSSA